MEAKPSEEEETFSTGNYTIHSFLIVVLSQQQQNLRKAFFHKENDVGFNMKILSLSFHVVKFILCYLTLIKTGSTKVGSLNIH